MAGTRGTGLGRGEQVVSWPPTVHSIHSAQVFGRELRDPGRRLATWAWPPGGRWTEGGGGSGHEPAPPGLSQGAALPLALAPDFWRFHLQLLQQTCLELPLQAGELAGRSGRMEFYDSFVLQKLQLSPTLPLPTLGPREGVFSCACLRSIRPGPRVRSPRPAGWHCTSLPVSGS